MFCQEEELNLENKFKFNTIYRALLLRPAAYNTLPSDLHDITDTSTFRKQLKGVLIDRAYH